MGKLTTYVIMMSGLMLLFYFSGLIQDTGNSALLNLILSPENMPTSDLRLNLFLVLEGILAAAVITIGLVSGNIELALMGPYAIYLFNLFWDFLAVYQKVAESNQVLATILFAPILILYMITIVEFWRGND